MNEPAAHPLFPSKDEDEDPPRVVSIYVKRDGKIWPAAFPADQLVSLEQIYAQWGGGTYTLIARDERQITAQITETMPGPSKPFAPESDAPPGSPAVAAPLPPPSGGGEMMAILTFVAQQQSNTMQMFLQMSQQTTQLMMGMFNSQAEQQRAHAREMAAAAERASARDAQMFAAMLSRAGASDPAAMFERGVQMATGLLSGGEGDEGDELSSVVEGAASILQGVQQFTGAGQQPPAAVPPAAPEAP